MFQDIELEFDELHENQPETFDDPVEGVANDEEILAKLDREPKDDVKSKVRRVMPKLDPERICGPRGIEIIPKIFEDFKIRGKGHEFDNLNNMMNNLEHWAHRLFPRMPFDEFLARLETLGNKRMIQVLAFNTISKIRNGESMDDVNNFVESEETADIFRGGDSTEEPTKLHENIAGQSSDVIAKFEDDDYLDFVDIL